MIEVGGRLRVWESEPVVDRARESWYCERYLPTLEALVELAPARILVTHGEPVLAGGSGQLRAALAAPPWSRERGAGVS